MKLLAAALALAAMTGSAAADGLASVRWDYRPLLLFTPTNNDPRLARQTTWLADAARGLRERRIAVLSVERNRVYALYGAPAVGADAKTLRRRFRVADDQFRVVLVGLDGGEKLSDDEPVEVDRLFALIDGMPMRQRELREQGE